MEKRLTVVLTCFNRKNKTINAMKSIVEKNLNLKFHFIIVNDGSTDGTTEAIKRLNYDVEIMEGNGSLFWCGGMRLGVKQYFKNRDKTDCLFINDDVDFFERSIEKIVEQQNNRKDTVIVGATCNKDNTFTYGLRVNRDKKGVWLNYIEPNDKEICGETMNANCVLIPYEIMQIVGNFDEVYTHSLGDYDFGFRISRMGYRLISSAEYVGICEKNNIEGSWKDRKLSRKQRLKLKEDPKGSPLKEWFHFLNKNYGLRIAIIHSISPYIKIAMGK